jgi:hypothetical protein
VSEHLATDPTPIEDGLDIAVVPEDDTIDFDALEAGPVEAESDDDIGSDDELADELAPEGDDE